ncbi:phage antirepressor KilAC domain-containing protein [Spirillospora sp. NPDC127200]
MTELQMFEFDPGEDAGIIHYPETGQSLRWVRIDGVVWLHFGDLCKGTGHTNSRSAIHLVEDEDKCKLNMRDVFAGHTAVNNLTAGPTSGNAEAWFVNEDGFTTLGLAGRGDGPRMFRRWIVKVVLPQFREQQRELSRSDLARMVLASEAERERALKERDEARRELDTARPKAEYVNTFVAGAADASTLRVLSNQLKVGERELRDFLVEQKVIYRKAEGSRWSRSRKRLVAEYSWHAYAAFKTWFTEIDQPEAPRWRNGQLRTTLYVTPVGKVRIAELIEKRSAA